MQKALLIFVVSNAFLMLIFSLYHSKNLIATVDSKMIAKIRTPYVNRIIYGKSY